MLQALPIAGAAVNPTRFMNKNTPLSDMTIDQFLLIHGENPTKKVIPERPIGPPRSRDELRAEASAAPEGKPLSGALPPVSHTESSRSSASSRDRVGPSAHRPATPYEEREAADRAFERPVPRPSHSPSPTSSRPEAGPSLTGGRPRPKAKVIRPVEPTPGGPFGKPMNEPCGDVLHLEFDIEDIGLVLLPLECEVLGEHPNMPHMVRTPGFRPDDPNREQDVFVGWADAL